MKSTISILVSFLLFGGIVHYAGDETPIENQPSTSTTEASNWDPDAGVIESLTKDAKVIASSNLATAQKVLDGNAQTHWISDAPFPNGFLKRKDLNLLYQMPTDANPQLKQIAQAIDGNEGTNCSILAKAGKASLTIPLRKNSPLHLVALSIDHLEAPVEISVTLASGQTKDLGAYLPTDLPNLTRFRAGIADAKSITLSSPSSFSIKEIAAMPTPPKEFVTIDLQKPKVIGWIETRHWSGEKNATASALYLSADNKKWYKVGDLNPNGLHSVSTRVEPAVKARYIKLEHTLVENDWNKVFAWKIDAYDDKGPFGQMPKAKANPHSFKELLGVNAIWGWGQKAYSDLHKEGEGADLYNEVATHARNYHFVNWEVTDPDHTPDYEAMKAGKGTEAQAWLDWDREYREWKKKNLEVHTAVKFGEIDGENWDTPYESAYKYGKAFAKHFGPTHGNGLVDVMEIGNEPWYYEAKLYRDILYGMAKGAKEIDPKMFVMPCALHAAYPQNETEGLFKNYMGARITEREAKYLDGINVHYYSWIHEKNGTRISVHPEHPASDMRGILGDIRFRDQNMPGKPIYLTEWGWDSDGGGEPCTHSECVSEEAQAIYAIRSLMMFARLGIDRMTWFFYANEGPGSSLFTRSGLTGSPDTGFKKKKAYYAFQSLINTLGDRHFTKVIKEDKRGWIYLLGDKNGNTTHLVAWRPISAEDKTKSKVQVDLARKPQSAWLLDGENAGKTPTTVPTMKNGKLSLELSAVPLIVEF